MKREVLKSLGVTDEVIDKIMMEHGNSVNSLKSKISDLEEQVSTYKQHVSERDKQLDGLKKAAGDSEKLQAQISKLQEENKKTKEAYDAKIEQMATDNLMNLALTNAGARDVRAVRAMLNLNDVKKDGDTLKGLDEQITKLKESDSWLFNETVKPAINGTKPAEVDPKAGTEPAPGSYEYFVQLESAGQL